MHKVAVAMTLVIGVAMAAAQPAPEPPGMDPRVQGTGTTSIPVVSSGKEVLGAESSGTSAIGTPIAIEQPIDPAAYKCGPGDVFELNFWGQQNFRLKIAADLEGRVFISKVGYVGVVGKTLTAVRAEVSRKVRGNYPGLQFELTLVTPRTFVVHLVDNVSKPGMYTGHALERVSTLVARAGGVTGSKRRIEVVRRTGGTVTADLLLYERTGDTKYNPFVLDGDVIRVPFAGVVVTVEGSVKKPGTYELVSSKDTTELFDLAGGFTSGVVRTLPLRIARRNAAQQIAYVDVPYSGDAPSTTALLDDDRVLVRGSEELQRSVQLIGAVSGAEKLDAAATAIRLPFVEGDSVSSLIDRAGGIKTEGDLKRSYISRPTGAETKLVPIDLEALLVRRERSADKPVHVGDVIVIPRVQYSVLVEGAVARSGMYPYNPKFRISEYVAIAGGTTRSARDLDESRLIDAEGKSRAYSRDLRPNPGDAIVIPERSFTRPEIVQIVLATAGLVLSGVAITLAATR